MRHYRFRVYFKAEAPLGAQTIQPAIATRIHKLGEPFPFLGAGWKMVDACLMLGIKDADGVEMCEGDIIQMANNEMGVIHFSESDCSYNIESGDETYAVGFRLDGRVDHRVVGSKYTMAGVLRDIISTRCRKEHEVEDED